VADTKLSALSAVTSPLNTANLYMADLAGPTSGKVSIAAAFNSVQPDGCRVYNTANISIPDATLTVLTFDTERYDNGGLHSTSSNTSRLTAARSGVYLIIANFEYAITGTAGAERAGLLKLNGTTYIAKGGQEGVASSFTYNNDANVTLCTLYHLTATDYVEVYAYQDSGGACDVVASANRSPEFMMQWLGI
jgi:hypothetical protein